MAHSHGLILTWNSDLSRQTHTVVHRSRFCLTRPRNALSGTRRASITPRHWGEPRQYARASPPRKFLFQREFRWSCHFWLELRPPRRHLASKPRFRSAPNFFGQMRAKRCDDCRRAMRVASAVGPLAIEIECPGGKPRRAYELFGRWSRCRAFAFGPNCDVAQIGATPRRVDRG